MKKRLIAFMLMIVTAFSALPFSAGAAELPDDTVGLYFEPTSLQPAYCNAIFINGIFYSYIDSADAQTVEIPKANLKEGENTVTFICGSSATKTYYDETVPPETRNHNDPKVKNLKITVDGAEFTPSLVTGHYITDQTIPAAESSRTEAEAYQADHNYTFGDGQPGGSPHPASLTIPYKIDFLFTLEGIESQEPVEPYAWNLEENGIYSGVVTVAAAASGADEELKLLVDGSEVTSKGNGTAAFRYSSNGIQANDGNQFKSGFYVNGTLAAYLNENEPEIALEQTQLQYGKENIITISIGNGSGPYDETKTPGSANYDDFSVSNFQLVLPDGEVIEPETVYTYRAKDQQTPAAEEHIREEAAYSAGTVFEMGDGFPAGSNLDLYYKIELVYRVPQVSDQIRYYALDTSAFEDGSHRVELSADGEIKKSAQVRFDNHGPELAVNFTEGASLEDGFVIEAEASDAVSEAGTVKAVLNGVEISLPYTVSADELGTGRQYLSLSVSDSQGNPSTLQQTFSVSRTSDGAGTADGEETDDSYAFHVKTPGEAQGPLTVDFYGAQLLKVQAFSGVSQETDLNRLDVSGASPVDAEKAGKTENAVSEGLPYDLYEVETEGRSGAIRLSLDARTVSGETLALAAYQPGTGEWKILDTEKSNGEEVSFTVEIQASEYAENGKLRVAVAPLLVDNGSDTLAWISDTQYYTQRQELKDEAIYERMTTWLKEQYEQGTISYVAHTGDIVETSSSEEQYIFASAAQDILDQAGVPNGVVSGNHDVGADIENLNYDLYQKYFGALRYSGQSWYGGSYGDNTSHYDLVTVAGHDMIILYLGMGMEATDETIAWANDVLEQYSHRTAIIATHEYLSPQADFITYARGQEIFEKIIVPNENVKMVLCGHDPGAARNIRQVPGTDRKVVEILADYQHQANGGDGFLRLLTFAGGVMENKSYSPVTGATVSFSDSQDNFTVDMELVENKRMVSSGTLSAAAVEETAFASVQTAAGETASASLKKAEVDFNGWFAVVTDAEGKSAVTDIVTVEITSVEPEKPTDPGTEEPADPSTEEPTDPSTEEPADPGTEEPAGPSTEEPTKPGTEETKAPVSGNGTGSGQNGKGDGGVLTGDPQSLLLWVSILVEAGIAAVVTAVSLRKKKTK